MIDRAIVDTPRPANRSIVLDSHLPTAERRFPICSKADERHGRSERKTSVQMAAGSSLGAPGSVPAVDDRSSLGSRTMAT